jgi:hypothetical protein
MPCRREPSTPVPSGARPCPRGGIALVLALTLVAAPVQAQELDPHAFFDAMVGEWVVDTEAIPGPGEEPVRGESREVARLLGDHWLVSEGSATMPDGRLYESIWVLGWDPTLEQVVGSWVVSIQTRKWDFTGSFDRSGRVLTLETEGPFMGDPSTLTRFREILEVVDEDHRTLRSLILIPDGDWFEFARAEYRRVGTEEESADRRP